MTGPTRAPDLVLVTVVAGSRRADLALPATVPVVELLPDLAAGLGVGSGEDRLLVTTAGRTLRHGAALADQDVPDGAVLALVADRPDHPAPVHDDVVEAVAEAVERDRAPWRPAAARRTTGAASAALLGLGATALAVLGGPGAAVGAGAAAGLLIAGALALARLWGEQDIAVGGTWAGAGYAAVAGHALGPTEGLALVAAGGSALVVAGAALLGLPERRGLAAAPVLVAGALVLQGVVVEAAGLGRPVAAALVLVLVVVAGGGFPALALACSGLAAPGPDDEPGPVDPGGVADGVRRGHEVLLGLTLGSGVVLVSAVPPVVTLGPAGTLLALTCCLLVALRARHHRDGLQALVGLGAGLAGAVTVAGAVLLLHPAWRPAVAGVAPALGVAVLLHSLAAADPTPRRQRWGDVLETACLVALPPLLLFTTGLLAVVGAWA